MSGYSCDSFGDRLADSSDSYNSGIIELSSNEEDGKKLHRPGRILKRERFA